MNHTNKDYINPVTYITKEYIEALKLVKNKEFDSSYLSYKLILKYPVMYCVMHNINIKDGKEEFIKHEFYHLWTLPNSVSEQIVLSKAGSGVCYLCFFWL